MQIDIFTLKINPVMPVADHVSADVIEEKSPLKIRETEGSRPVGRR